MRGHVAVIEELVRAKPESVKERIVSDDSSVLHLCVRFNHLSAWKFLVETMRLEGAEDNQILCGKDKDGNTIFHLAVKNRQFKSIEYLVSVPEMSPAISGLNGVSSSSSALDTAHSNSALRIHQLLAKEGALLERSSNTLIVQESAPQVSGDEGPSSTDTDNAHSSSSAGSIDTPAEQLHIWAGMDLQPQPELPVQLSPSLSSTDHPSQSSQPHRRNINPAQSAGNPAEQSLPLVSNNNHVPPSAPSSRGITPQDDNNSFWDSRRVERFFKTYLLSQINWMDSSQLLVATTVIATMTFQSVLSPPGGVWSGDTNDGGHQCNKYGYCEAGTVVLGYSQSPDYVKFIFFNSASFFFSLCALLLIISGFPLNNIVMKWIMTLLMVAVASCMLLTYMWDLGMTSPDHIYYKIKSLGYLLVGIWGFLLSVIGIFQVVRFIYWLRSTTSAPQAQVT